MIEGTMHVAAAASGAGVSSQALSNAHIEELVEACIEQTGEALIQTHAASRADVLHAMDTVRQAQAQGQPSDLLAAIAQLHGAGGDDLAMAVEALSARLAATLNPSPQLIPFAGRLIAPTAFYESFDRLHKLARALLTPVIFAEDAGSIGVASANPIAATLLAGKIQDLVSRRFDIRPFLTIARLDYASWTFITHKHFEL